MIDKEALDKHITREEDFFCEDCEGEVECDEEMWVPTIEDIAYQDSMYTIIRNTQSDIDTIKDNIVYIIERLDHVDGTYDSIRYVKGGKIDKKRN